MMIFLSLLPLGILTIPQTCSICGQLRRDKQPRLPSPCMQTCDKTRPSIAHPIMCGFDEAPPPPPLVPAWGALEATADVQLLKIFDQTRFIKKLGFPHTAFLVRSGSVQSIKCQPLRELVFIPRRFNPVAAPDVASLVQCSHSVGQTRLVSE